MTKKEQIEFLPEQKERGKNIHLKISVYRHGEKTPEGELSEIGFAHAKRIGHEKDVPKDGIKAYVSPFRRTMDTTEQIIKGIEEQNTEHKIFKTRTRESLAPPNWRNFEKLKADIISITKKEGHDGLVRYILSVPEGKEDLEEWTNALAYLVDKYIRMSHRLYNDSDVELMNVAHEPLLSSFLRSVIVLRDKEGKKVDFEDINQIGGPFQPGEYFNLEISVDNTGKEHLKIELRDKTYEVDKNKLKAMAEKAKEQTYEGRTERQNWRK